MQGGCKVIMKLFFSCYRLCNGSWVRARSLRQHDQENQVIITLQLSVPIVTMEEEIVGVNVRLNKAMRQQFPKHRHVYLRIFRGLGSYFKIGSASYVALM